MASVSFYSQFETDLMSNHKDIELNFKGQVRSKTKLNSNERA